LLFWGGGAMAVGTTDLIAHTQDGRGEERIRQLPFINLAISGHEMVRIIDLSTELIVRTVLNPIHSDNDTRGV
jgi:hypothetical protein